MKSIRIVGFGLVVMFALGAVVASGASAVGFLFAEPAGGFPMLFLSKGGTVDRVTVGGREVRCTGVDSHGLVESVTLGLVLAQFLGCSTKISIFTIKCSNTPQEGEVDVNLGFHLGEVLPSKNPALIFSLPNGKFEFKCTSLATIVLEGEVIGLLLETGTTNPVKSNTSYSTAELHFKEAATGIQEDQTFDLSPGGEEMTSVHMTTSLNGGAAEETAEVGSSVFDGFKNAGGNSVNVELRED